MNATNLTPVASKGKRPLLGAGVFLLALLIGNLALIAGMNDGNPLPGAGMFALACIVWWIAYRLGGMERRIGIAIGILSLALWIFNLANILTFRRYVSNSFVLASSAEFVVLIGAFITTEMRRRPQNARP